MARTKFSTQRRNSNRSRQPSSRGGYGRRSGTNTDRAVQQLARAEGARSVTRSANTPTASYGGTIVPYAAAAKIPVPYVPKPGIHKVRQLVDTFTNSNGISGSGSYPYFQASNAGATFPTIAFAFEDLPQAATMAALFDQYKIDLVEMIITPSSNALSIVEGGAGHIINPQVIAVLDFDDDTALASEAAALQYEQAVQFNGTQGVHIRIKPSVTPAYYASGAFSGYGVSGPQWIDCNSNDVVHYGVKFAVQGLAGASTDIYQWNVTNVAYHVSLRNVR